MQPRCQNRLKRYMGASYQRQLRAGRLLCYGVAGLIVVSVLAGQVLPGSSQPDSQLFCRALADFGMDANQSESEFTEPPLERVGDQVFIVGVNWDLRRFATRTGSGGRRRYILARLDPDSLQPVQKTSGDAPYNPFGSSGVGLITDDPDLLLLASGQLWLLNAHLEPQSIIADLTNTVGPIAAVDSGDLIAISANIVKRQMRYSKLWVFHRRTHAIVFTHDFQLTERAVALAIDEINRAVVLSTNDGVQEMSYVDGSTRRIVIGFGADTWAFHCGPYLVIPRSERGLANSYAIFSPLQRRARYWDGSGETYSAGTCAGDLVLTAAYKFKVHPFKSNGEHDKSRTDQPPCVDCGAAYDRNRLPDWSSRRVGSIGYKQVIDAKLIGYDLTIGKKAKFSAALPLEIPLASAWDPDRKKLFVMTTSHVCSFPLVDLR